MTGGMHYTPSNANVSNFFQFSSYIFSADTTPNVLKLCRFTNVKVLFLVLLYVFNFDLFEFSAAILEKGLLSLVEGSLKYPKYPLPKLSSLFPKVFSCVISSGS